MCRGFGELGRWGDGELKIQNPSFKSQVPRSKFQNPRSKFQDPSFKSQDPSSNFQVPRSIRQSADQNPKSIRQLVDQIPHSEPKTSLRDNPKSAIRVNGFPSGQSTIRNPSQWLPFGTIHNPQSTIHNPQSKIRNTLIYHRSQPSFQHIFRMMKLRFGSTNTDSQHIGSFFMRISFNLGKQKNSSVSIG